MVIEPWKDGTCKTLHSDSSAMYDIIGTVEWDCHFRFRRDALSMNQRNFGLTAQLYPACYTLMSRDGRTVRIAEGDPLLDF